MGASFVATLKWPFVKGGFQLVAVGLQPINWPGLNKAVYLTLYHKPYAAVYNFQPLGKEGLIVRRTFFHSIILATLLGLLVMAQQYLIPWIIPH